MTISDFFAQVSELISTKTDLFWVAVTSAIVSASVSYVLKKRETRHQAEVSYEYEQRKKLREVIGRYHGRLLSAANSMNHRLWNLYTNCEKDWLNPHGQYNESGYYFLS